MTRAMPSSVSDQCCPGCVSEVSIRALRALLRLGNHSALLARELHYWNLKLQIGHIQHSKNLTTGDTDFRRGTEHRGTRGASQSTIETWMHLGGSAIGALWPWMLARKESELPFRTRWGSPRRGWRRSSVRISAVIWGLWDKCWRNTTSRRLWSGCRCA